MGHPNKERGKCTKYLQMHAHLQGQGELMSSRIFTSWYCKCSLDKVYRVIFLVIKGRRLREREKGFPWIDRNFTPILNGTRTVCQVRVKRKQGLLHHRRPYGEPDPLSKAFIIIIIIIFYWHFVLTETNQFSSSGQVVHRSCCRCMLFIYIFFKQVLGEKGRGRA